MKTWKKIVALTTVTGVALGALAYFAKKKSLEDDFCDEFDDAFDDFDEEIADDNDTTEDVADRNYVPLDMETTETTVEETADDKSNSTGEAISTEEATDDDKNSEEE